MVEQALRELLLDGLDVSLGQVGAQQAHAAVDVEADAAWGDDRVRVGHVKGRHVANRKAVAGVQVWQPDRAAHDARQSRHVGNLLQRWQEALTCVRLGELL